MNAEANPEMRRLRAILSGRVQGVGMRVTVAALAEKLGLTGWVTNLPDGRVELAAEGPQRKLDELLFDLQRQMPGYIRGVERSWEPASGEWRSFSIRP
ncbi:MAG: acylphosphatase [Planctomycetota bacterium]